MHASTDPLRLAPGATHAVRRVDAPWWAWRLHHHDGAEVLWISAGAGTVTIGDRTLSFAAGDLFVLGQGLPHAFATAPHPQQPPAGFLVHLPTENSPLAATAAWDRFLPFLRTARRGLVCRLPRTSPLATALRTLPQRGDLATLAAFTGFLDLLCRQRWRRILPAPMVADPDRAAPGWLHRVCARVQAQLATPVTLTGLCRLAGVGRSALCAGFRTHYRCTPLAWVTERRLAQACTLLAAGDRTVLDIALACGFGSIATFNRRFARVYGCAPTAWRRRQRSG